MAKASLRQPTGNMPVSLGDIIDGKMGDLETLPPGADLALTDEDELDEQSQAIERIAAELGSAPNDAFLTVYEVSTTAKEPDARLFKCSPSDWDGLLDRIVEEFGAGKYRILGFVPKDNGVGVKRFMNRIVVLKESKSMIRAKSAPPEDKTMSALQSMQQTMLAGFTALAEGIKAATTPKQEDETAWLHKMALYKELFAPAPQAQQPAADPLAMIDKILDVKSKFDLLGGSGEGSSSVMPALLSMAKPIVEGIAEQQRNQARQTQLHGHSSEPQNNEALQNTQIPHETNPHVESQNQTEGADMNLMIAALLNAAKNNYNPQTYAELILDQLPEQMLDDLVNDDNWWSKLCLAIPGAAPYETWFKSVHEVMLEMLTDDAEDDNQVETQPPATPDNAKQA